ncbi:MAG: hypothetical protein KAR00_03195 [Candidatus Pacebacteria bacterium]|nr:hypothetical protein [Candidatus Paceibacterota bacterium]
MDKTSEQTFQKTPKDSENVGKSEKLTIIKSGHRDQRFGTPEKVGKDGCGY